MIVLAQLFHGFFVNSKTLKIKTMKKQALLLLFIAFLGNYAVAQTADEILNQYYENQDKENFENLTLINEDNKTNNSPLCPINLGIRFLDQVKKIENINKCRFKKIAHPILLLPFLSRSSEIIGKKIFFKFDQNEFFLNFRSFYVY